MRAVSTVLDVTICLLLLGAAVVTLTVPSPAPHPSTADDTAAQLAATTANASETVRLDRGAHAETREVRGTAAAHLARAALANLSLSGHHLAPTTGEYRRAVLDRVRRTLDWAPASTAVTARWAPYPGAPITGRVHVGPTPPRHASVGTATVRVPVPLAVERSGSSVTYRGLAEKLSETLVATTLPGPGSRDGRQRTRRERRRIDAYLTALDGLGDADPATVRRRRIAGALADRLESDMRARFDSPHAAAAALDPGTVAIVVREWDG